MEIIKEHQGRVLPHYKLDAEDFAESETSTLCIRVRRTSVLEDSLKFLSVIESMIRRKPSLIRRPLQIKFVGESGQDVGGVRREFASLLVEDIAKCGYLQGPSMSRSFAHDVKALQDGTYVRLGQLVALTLLQGGCGLPILADCVADYILFGQPKTPSMDDIPDPEIADCLLEVSMLFQVRKYYLTRL